MKALLLLDRIQGENKLTKNEFLYLLEKGRDLEKEVFLRAQEVRKAHFGNRIYIRGLVEFSNYCKNDCYYCGIRASNKTISRYRLEKRDLEELIEKGKKVGLSTYVLQAGEDPYFTDERLVDWITYIRQKVPDVAITLSVGERPYESYKRLKEAGADRYLLRHESANPRHYSLLHPGDMTFETRSRALYDLKSLGYQVGAGFMVGSPYQTLLDLASDLHYLQKLEPEMIGVGPFLSHKDTPFGRENNGDLHLTLYILGLLRIMFPKANIPSTTALQTLSEEGRILGLRAGANVFMPNLSPKMFRESYSLYDNKASFALEGLENLEDLKNIMRTYGYEIDMGRGDYLGGHHEIQ